MDEEEIVDQADTVPSDNEETNIEGSGAFDPATGAEAGAYDQPDAGRAPPVAQETDDPAHEGADFIPFDQVDTPDELPAEASPTQGVAPAAAQPDFVPFGQESAAAAPAFIPFGKEPGTDVTKPGAADDNQFRGYIPTALRKAVQGFLNINIPVEKGLARLIFGDEDNAWYQNAEARGKNVQGFVDTSALRTTKAENESVTGRAAETLGNLAPLFLLGGGLGGVAAAGLQMGASGVETGAQRAKAAGASPEQQYQQGLAEGAIGVGVGAATMGAATLLKPFARSGPGMMNWAQTTLKEAAREGVVFGTAMEAQEYLGEQAAKAIYDPKAEYHFDMVRFLSGLAAGGAIGGTRGAFQRYRPGNPTTGEATPPEVAPPEGTPEAQRQEAKAAPPANLSAGTAHENVKPSKVDETVGNPQSTPGADAGNTGRWAKRVERKIAEGAVDESKTGVVLLENGEVAPDVKAALEPLKRPAEPAPPEPTGEPPAAPRSSDSAPPPAEAPRPEAPPQTSASVPFMITRAMRADLAKRGMTPEQIGELTPQQAHDILNRPEPVAPPVETRPQPIPDEAPRYEGQPTPQQDVVQPHPEYLRSADNPPLPESPRPLETNQRAPDEGSTPVPEPVTRPVTTDGESGAGSVAKEPTVEPQARPTPDVSAVEPAANPAATARERETANLVEKPTVEPQGRPQAEPAATPPPAARAPRILEDLSAPPREFIPFQGQREEARALEEQRFPPSGAETGAKVENEGPPGEYQLKKGYHPIKDASGRVIGGHKEEAVARVNTNRLKKAGELMNERFPFEGAKYDPRKPADMKAYRDRAVQIVKAAEQEGWKDYYPKQKVTDQDYRRAPPEAIFMKEMLALAKKPFNQERAVETMQRELDLRGGPEGVDAVRAQRREAGTAHTLQRLGKMKEFDDNKHAAKAEENKLHDDADRWLQENDDTWSKHLNRTLVDC